MSLKKSIGILSLSFAMVAMPCANGNIQPYQEFTDNNISPYRHAILPDKNKKASFVIDADTGQIFHENKADELRHPASITKIMALLLAFDALENGTITLNDTIDVFTHSARVPSTYIKMYHKNGNDICVITQRKCHDINNKENLEITIENAIQGLIVKSYNDVSAAMDEKISGTEEEFIKQMNIKAQQIGMKNTVFMNTSGIYDPKQLTTARDMAILATYIIDNHQNYYSYFSTINYKHPLVNKNIITHNRLMITYPGMDGLKTGFIRASGFNIVASVSRNGHRVIGILFGGTTSSNRNDEIKNLLDDAFLQIELSTQKKKLSSTNNETTLSF